LVIHGGVEAYLVGCDGHLLRKTEV
jgi:hypothetical protein